MNPTLTVWLQLIGLLAVEIAVIVGLAVQLQRFTKSAIWRRTIWHACILSLLLLVVFEFTGAARGLAGWFGKTPAHATPVQSSTVNASSRISASQSVPPPQRHPELQPAFDQHATRNTQQPTFPNSREIIKESGGLTTVPILSNSITSESLSILWLGVTWLVGAGVVVGRALIARMLLEIFRWQRRGSINVEIEETVRVLALRLGIKRRVRLLESSHICAPVAFGIFRPTIGLPLQFDAKFNSAQQEAMLAHELAHLAGNDPAWYLLADLLAAMLWWHPLIWWSRRQLQTQSELAADEASLLVADGPGVLAECLVELGARLAQTRSFIPLGVAGTGYRSGLGRRVERLVKLEGAVWRPPNRIHCGLASTLGPVALVAAAILCTAWAVPPALTKGENMQTMRQTWKKSLAAFALLTAFGSNNNPALADATDAQTAAKLEAAAVAAANVSPPGGTSGSSSTVPDTSPQLADQLERLQKEHAREHPENASPHLFATRLARINPPPKNSKEKELVESKLNRIVLSTVKYDGLPLGEVINNLVEESTLRDPDKQGINFVLNREAPAPARVLGPIDPATGLPAAPLSTKKVDLSSVTVQISPALKNVRLIDVLEVITKTADRPIHYSIEDYGVVFSLGAARPADAQSAKSMAESMEMMRKFDADRSQSTKSMAESMEMMSKADATHADVQNIRPFRESVEAATFTLSTTHILNAVESTFGIKPDRANLKNTIQELFQRLGIDMNGQNKAFFYNEKLGLLMVRGTRQDLAVVKAAVETLGGMAPPSPFFQQSAGFGGSGGGGGAGR